SILRPFLCTTTPPPEICPLSLHDALPIYYAMSVVEQAVMTQALTEDRVLLCRTRFTRLGERVEWNLIFVPSPELLQLLRETAARSEDHTSELQSRENLVCRLLLEKKKTTH